MRKRTEEQPVDNLFAHKLGNMSLPPNPDGFERLQARMSQRELKTRAVFWRNSVVRQYAAMAACVFIACLIGWLHFPTDRSLIPGKATVATSQSHAQPPLNHAETELKADEHEVAATYLSPEWKRAVGIEPRTIDLPSGGLDKQDNDGSIGGNRRSAINNSDMDDRQTGTQDIVPVTPEEQIAKNEVTAPSVAQTLKSPMPVTTVTPVSVDERVLVVTIAEPEVLLAARQTAKQSTKDEEVAVAADKPDKESKAATLWQQVKRIRQGEIFARKDATEDDRGLLGRAYSGLKQSFDKDKSAKQ